MADAKTDKAASKPYTPSRAFILFRKLMGESARVIATAPAKWGVKGWVITLSVILSATIGYFFKWPFHSFFGGDEQGAPEFFADIGKYCGDGEMVAIITIALLAIGLIGKKTVLLEAGVVLTVAGLWCAAITLTSQIVLAEARPEEGGAMAFFMLGGHGVSGHASSAAVLLWPLYSVLGETLKKGWQIALGVLLTSWALLVAWSRMWDDKHFLWNVILGMTVGLSMGYAAVTAWKHSRL